MNNENTQSKDSTTKQTGAILAGKFIALFVSFIMPVFLTRYLSKSEYGVYNQFLLVITFCVGFFSMGIQSNLYFFYPNASAQSKKYLVFNTLSILMILDLFTIGLISIPEVAKYLIGEGELTNYRIFILISILFLMPLVIIEPLTVAKKDNIINILYPPSEVMLRLILIISFAVLIRGIYSIFLGVLVSAFMCFMFMLIYVYKEIGPISSIKVLFNLSAAKEQLYYSIPFGMAVGLNAIAQRFDKILCITFLTTSQFATYSIAFYGVPGLQQFYDALSQVYLLKMVKKHKENSTKDIIEIYKSLITKTYSLSLPALMVMALYAKKIIVAIFTRNYLDSVQLFRVYLFVFLFIMLGAGLVLRATGRTKDTFKSYIYSSIITIPLTIILIKYVGIWGAMTSALISIILPKVIMLIKEMHLLQSDIFNFFPWKKIATIALISFATLIPFLVLNFFLTYGIILAAILGLIYLIIVSILEIKYELFIIESSKIKKRIADITVKLGLK